VDQVSLPRPRYAVPGVNRHCALATVGSISSAHARTPKRVTESGLTLKIFILFPPRGELGIEGVPGFRET
jgi:hypothetical protein